MFAFLENLQIKEAFAKVAIGGKIAPKREKREIKAILSMPCNFQGGFRGFLISPCLRVSVVKLILNSIESNSISPRRRGDTEKK
jgi:hypothetical protein